MLYIYIIYYVLYVVWFFVTSSFVHQQINLGAMLRPRCWHGTRLAIREDICSKTDGVMLEGRSQTVRKTKTTQLELDSARKKIGPAFWFTSVRYTFKWSWQTPKHQDRAILALRLVQEKLFKNWQQKDTASIGLASVRCQLGQLVLTYELEWERRRRIA